MKFDCDRTKNKKSMPSGHDKKIKKRKKVRNT